MALHRLLALLLIAGLFGCPSAEPPADDDDDAANDDDAADDDDIVVPDGYSFDAEDGGPSANFCLEEPPSPPPGGALCDVSAGDRNVVFTGIVLSEDEVLFGGQVRWGAGGDIACVGCDCAEPGATELVCPFGVLSPGLINAHDHISFTQNHPVPHGDDRYQHRHDWRRGNNGHQSLSVSGGADDDERTWGELRFAMTGGTSINGSGFSNGLLRNLDSDNEGLGLDTVNYETFPLSDTSGFVAESGCDYPGIDSPGALNNIAYAPHIAEGIDRAARNELLCLSSDLDGGEDLTEENTAVIHAVGITAAEASMMAQEGAAVIWSPRSNVDLYGNTAPVTLLDAVGVTIGLGTDWTASGSMNLLRELACADSLNQDHYGGALGDWQLWTMGTLGGAQALGVDAATGSIVAGKVADLALFDGRSHPSQPFRAILEAGVQDVWATWRGGEPLAGETDLIAEVPEGSGCEEIADDVCGTTKRVCLAEVGRTFSQLQQSNTGSYDLYACGEPDQEPSCLPFRPFEYDGPTSTDPDGDGVTDGDDNCPTVFNPVRLLDLDGQADADADGLGDVCDPCPIGEDSNGDCVTFDPDDRDADGVDNAADNCPVDANFLQNDTDMDGLGDVCDVCPLVFNVEGENCPASVYEVKQGLLDDGTAIRLSRLLVTGVNGDGFFGQVLQDEQDPTLGADFSGVFMYAPAVDSTVPLPAVGELISFDAVVNFWFGQWQLENYDNVDVLDSGLAPPSPIPVDPDTVATGGSLAEVYESLVVSVADVEVTDHDPPAGPGDEDPTGAFVVNDGLRVNDFLTSLEPRPLVGDRVNITGVLRFANDDSKLEPRTAGDVSLVLEGPPELASFGPAEVFLVVGDVGASTVPPLVATLDRPAPAGGTEIELLNYGDTIIGAPATLVVPEGELSAELLLDGLAVDTASLEAVLAPTLGETEVVVLAADWEPDVASLAPPLLTLPIGFAADLTLTLDAPAPTGGWTVALSADPADTLSLPPTVTVPEGTFTATFTVSADAEGSATVTAGSATATVDVTAEPPRGLIITEVLYDTPGSDDGQEWVELLNDAGTDIDLSGWSLGGGGTDWEYTMLQLSGVIPAGACWVIGGPTSGPDNANPAFDVTEDFSPDLQNSGSTADGVALFDVPAAQIGSSTLPVSVVLYGGSNGSGLIGPDGAPADVHVGDAGGGSSVELGAGEVWAVQATPTPGDCTAAQ